MLEFFKRFNGFVGGIFIFGAILILLGITNGLPDLGLCIAEKCRLWAWIGGIAFCLLSIALHFACHIRDDDGVEEVIDTSILSPTQKKITEVIADEYKLHGVVSQSFIEAKFREISVDEMYYRLEHLVCMRIIIKSDAGYDGQKQRFSYKLSSEYRGMMKIAEVAPTRSYGTSAEIKKP